MRDSVVSLDCDAIDCYLAVFGEVDKFTECRARVVDKGEDYIIYNFLSKTLPIDWMIEMSKEYRDLIFQLTYCEIDRDCVEKIIVENGMAFQFTEG